jgi:hypothetical protein
MGAHMKTTVEINEELLQHARRVAGREKTTLRALLEEGLRRALEARRSPARFRLRKAAFKGKGLQPGFSDASWERIRDAAYEGRGG